MGITSFLCYRLLPVLAIALAIPLGWFASHEMPLGLFFATMIPLMQRKLPATIIGHGKMTGTPPVPDDFQPQPRPAHELFLTLPGNNNNSMPQNGLGMCCRSSAYDDELVYRTVLWYLLKGGRHIDTAHLYLNHAAVGRGVREAMRRGVPRHEIFVTTKIFPYHYGYDTTKTTVPTYLTELGLDYIDLVLMHFPAPFPYIVTNECTKRGISNADCRVETWRALSELTQQELVEGEKMIRNIGVSNFAVRHLQQLAGLGAPIANNQIQYSPFAPESVQETVRYCAEHGITVTAYSPLGGLVDQDKAFTYDILQTVADRHQRPVSQIMLRWALQSGAAVIPGTGNPHHMDQNLDIYNFVLSDADMATINGLRRPEHAQKFYSMDVREMD
jgi:diketogulonate reductase-like aldo/keto reductase